MWGASPLLLPNQEEAVDAAQVNVEYEEMISVVDAYKTVQSSSVLA
jgi:hypothetical protein